MTGVPEYACGVISFPDFLELKVCYLLDSSCLANRLSVLVVSVAVALLVCCAIRVIGK